MFRCYYAPADEATGVAGISAKPTPAILQLQTDVIAATKPFTGETATIDAFAAPQATPALDKALIDCSSTFAATVSGAKFNSRVSIGVAPKDYFDKMVAEPFGASVFRPRALRFINLGPSVGRRGSSRSGICK